MDTHTRKNEPIPNRNISFSSFRFRFPNQQPTSLPLPKQSPPRPTSAPPSPYHPTCRHARRHAPNPTVLTYLSMGVWLGGDAQPAMRAPSEGRVAASGPPSGNSVTQRRLDERGRTCELRVARPRGGCGRRMQLPSDASSPANLYVTGEKPICISVPGRMDRQMLWRANMIFAVFYLIIYGPNRIVGDA